MKRVMARCRWWTLAVLLFGPFLLASCGGDKKTDPADPVPICEITPRSLAFDTVTVGQTKDLAFTIKNSGGGTLAGSVTETCSAYSITLGGGSYSLTANQEKTVVVRFGPTTGGAQPCAVSLGATACAAVECGGAGRPRVTGSCCSAGGICTVTAEAGCSGSWTVGGTCFPSPCDSLPPLAMVLVPADTFAMGSPVNELWRKSDETRHEVALTAAIYISIYEVTQAEWAAVMGWNASSFLAPQGPVESVTWYDAVSYCNERSRRDRYTPAYTIADVTKDGNHIIDASVGWNQAANGYRLPTEAEWEYSCRASSTTAFSNGGITNSSCLPLDPNLDPAGWYCGNASGTTHDVGGKAANAWELHDVHGNVGEWCWDWYAGYPSASVSDPTGPPSGSHRVLRGGGWNHQARNCRSAVRLSYYPYERFYSVGLRLARTAR